MCLLLSALAKSWTKSDSTESNGMAMVNLALFQSKLVNFGGWFKLESENEFKQSN